MIERSESFVNLAGAILAVQKAVQGVKRDSTNPHFKNTYASFEAVVAALRPHCIDAGIIVVQAPAAPDERGLTPVETLVVHAKSGEWMKSTLALPVVKHDAQGVGSAISYASRYSLMALFNLAPTDDDGNAASAGKTNGNGHAEAAITPEQVKTIRLALREVDADEAAFVGWLKVPSIEEVPANLYARAMAALDSKRAARK